MKVLIACEFSGIVRDSFIKRGHDAVSCDLLPSERPGPHIQDDVLNHLNDGWDMMIAHPPCTYLTVTGNKWFKPEYAQRFPTRLQDRKEAINFFMALAQANIPRIAIENPVGIMSTIYRKPDQIIQPYYFGHSESKTTCLWLKGLEKLRYGNLGIQINFTDTKVPPLTDIKIPDFITFKSGKRMATWYVKAAKDKKNRSNIRSRTFQGIADAMAAQWSSP